MTYADLTKWRLMAPFAIAGAIFLPYLLVTIPKVADIVAINQLVVPLIALLIAGVYVGLDVRGSFWKREIRTHVGPQIRTALLALLPVDLEVSDDERTVLSRDDVFKDLTGVFWEAVDRDPMLVAQKPYFYSNGFVYSTAIDVYVLMGVSGLAFLAAFLVFGRSLLAVMGGAYLAIAVVSKWLVVPRARARHLALSREQLDLLSRNQREFVQQRFREIVIARRQAGALSMPAVHPPIG